MRMPRRRWTDFPAGLHRVRLANGLTQSELGERLNVDQATVSRWERGSQIPDLETQNRLRDMLFRGQAVIDAILFHFVRTAPGHKLLISADGHLLAASEASGGRRIEGASISRYRAPALQQAWHEATAGGLFTGEMASAQFAADLGGEAEERLPMLVHWYPLTMTDGRTLLLAEMEPLDEARFAAAQAEGLRVTPLEAVL